MNHRARSIALLFAAASTVSMAAWGAGDAASASSAAPAAGTYRQARWPELIPADWDPMKQFRSPAIGMMSDYNPHVLKLMREMREIWDNAPTNPKMDGAAIKLPGYIVPLDQVNGQMTEFLLVPYFGACIHVPPPPANQIVHVISAKPLKDLHSMDTVWVSGTLKSSRLDSVMGASGYEMQAAAVDRYVRP